jgi:hypothetical protein
LLGWRAKFGECGQQLREEHARLNPFALKKNIERKLKNFFTLLGNLDRESTKA